MESVMAQLSWGSGATHDLEVEAGRVVCPRRGSRDIEGCWTCPAYRGLSTGATERILCRPDFTMIPLRVWTRRP